MKMISTIMFTSEDGRRVICAESKYHCKTREAATEKGKELLARYSKKLKVVSVLQFPVKVYEEALDRFSANDFPLILIDDTKVESEFYYVEKKK